MKQIRILSLAVLILCGWASAYGQSDFNPSTPPEPGAPIVKHQLTLLAEPANGGTVSGGGRYDTGKSVNVRASANSYFSFVGWRDTKGEVVSDKASFSYTIPDRNDTLIAHFDYTPSNPNEPQPAQEIQYFQLMVKASQGGSASGGGKYQAGKSVYLSSSGDTGYAFVNWTNSKGEQVSTSRSFYYTTKQYNDTLTANYVFDPALPVEPSEPLLYHKLYLNCNPSDGGYFNISSGNKYKENSSVDICAYTNQYYTFVNWTIGDSVVSNDYSFSYIMPKHDVTLTANYTYDPSNPNEPGEPSNKEVNIYAMTENGVRGQTIKYPIYLENALAVKGIEVDIHFPKGFSVNTEDVRLAGRASGHNVEVSALGDNNFRFDVTGDNAFEGSNGKMFDLLVSIPDTATMGKTYPVKFTHGLMYGTDGAQTTIPVRNGNIYVEKDSSPEPSSSLEATPDDPEGWNDLSRPHKLVLEGKYENPDGLAGMIEYAAEDSDDWHQLTEMMMLGETFNDTLVVMFDASREKHVIRFRIKDITGDTSLLPSIEYLDVSFRQYSGIVDKIYTGDSIYQEVECTDVANMQVTTGKYSNNVNAGTASFCIEGVFPYTIGRKLCTFQINPAPLMGSINLTTDSYVYDGQQHCPEWSFTNESYSKLEKGKDYDVTYTDNRYPGTAKVTVKGKGNYTSELTKTFFIDRAPLKDELFSITLPDEDITYDGNEHKASATSSDGVGEVSFTYTLHGESTPLVNGPTEEGHYDIYMKIADGELYYGRQSELIGSFAIYRFDEAEWQSLSLLYAELQQMGVTLPWDIAGGAKNVSKFEELTIREGHVVGISLANKEMTGLFPVGVTAFPRLENIDLSGNKLSGNISTAIAAIRMQNATAFSNLHTLNLSNNKYSGNVGILGNSIPGLSSLNVSNNKFEDLYPALPASIVNLDITHQEMDRVVDLNISELSFADMATKVPTILLYNHDIRNYNTSINLLCTKEDLATFNKYDTDEWAMQLAVSNGQISIPYVSIQNAYHGESGDTLNVLNMTDNDITDGSTFKIALSFSPGDANFRNGVEATDLQATILYAFGEYRYNPFNFTAADTYKDDYNRINVQDVVCTVNLLLSDGDDYDAKVMERAKTSTNQVQDALPNAMIYIKDSKVILYSSVPVAVISIKADKPVDWTISDYGLSESVRGGMMVGYSLLGNTIPSGENVIGLCHENTTILKAQLSDYAAREIIVRICNNEVTALERINIDLNEPEFIYDLSGKKIQERTKGINIIRKGSRHYKVIK